MSKFYAVKQGRKIGVFRTWSECEALVKGYSGAIYKSFQTENEAWDFIKGYKKEIVDDGIIAYVDGSYNVKNKEYGYGCVLIENQKIIKELSGKDNNLEYVSMRNVAGEILGSLKAIEFAVQMKYSMICIYYDYEGIEKWANKEWKANKIGTKEYVKKIDDYRKVINIQFIKVLAHSGDYYNDKADLLAKKAVGING